MQKRQVLVGEVNGKDRASTGAVVYFYGCFKALSKAVYKKLKQIDLLIHSILDQDGNLVNYIHDKLLSRTENTTNNDVEMTQTPTLHEAETENDIEDAESCKMLK